MKSTIALLSLAFAVILPASAARAQPTYYYVVPAPLPNPYTRPHFYLGVEAVAVVVLNQTGPRGFLADGGGFNIFLGGRLSRHVALELGWQPTFHSNQVDIFGRPISFIGLEALTLDIKILFLRGPVQPYFTIGGGAYLLGDNFSVFAEGGGYQIGGGIDFWLGHHVSLGLKAQYRGVGLVDYDPQNDNTYLSLFTGALNLTIRF
jgi:hypothetical protein